MASMNKVILLGNLGQDPEIKRLSNGAPIANLSIATSESWRDKQTGERKERTEWHRIVVCNEGLVKVIEQYLAKGDQIMVTGQLEHRSWEDQDGKKRFATDVVLRPFKSELQIIRCKAWDRAGRRDDVAIGDEGGADENVPAGRSAALAAGYGPKGAGTGNAKRQDDFDDEIPF